MNLERLSLVPLAALVLHSGAADTRPPRRQYLALQIFTASRGSESLGQSFPPLQGTLGKQVDGLVRAVGDLGSGGRKLGFIVGPLAFDESDQRVRDLMREAFAVALQKNIATGFHLDDSMFWDRRTDLNRPENIEWIDWKQTPNTGRRLDWSSTPTKIMPQLCFNAPAVVEAVKRRAAVIGEEVRRGLKVLRAAKREELFIGVIAGWETQMGRDFATGKYSGFHALANEGYRATNPPADVDAARVAVVKGFIDLWTESLANAGVPDDKIYSHTAYLPRVSFDMARFGRPGTYPDSFIETNNLAPPSASFGRRHVAGFSTYPQFGLLEELQAERGKHGNPPWASCEGTAVDPGAAENGDLRGSMEHYLGNLFNRGAVLVNVFGWAVGPPSNPFRTVAEGADAIAAYQKFLRGEKMQDDPPAQLPSSEFFDKLRTLQKELPAYLAKHGSGELGAVYESLNRDLKAKHFADAEKAVDQILQTIKS